VTALYKLCLYWANSPRGYKQLQTAGCQQTSALKMQGINLKSCELGAYHSHLFWRLSGRTCLWALWFDFPCLLQALCCPCSYYRIRKSQNHRIAE